MKAAQRLLTFRITLISEGYQPSSFPQNHLWNHNFYRNLHMPSFLAQSQQSYRKLQSTGRQQMLLPWLWGFIKEPEAMVVILLNNKAFPDWWRKRTFSVLLISWPLRHCWLERDCHSQGWPILGDSLELIRKHALCMQITDLEPIFFTASSILAFTL